jgi:transposase
MAASERDEQARNEFRQIQADLKLPQLVVLDECATNISLHRTHGYSKRGSRVYGKAPRNRGKNLTLICALNQHGLDAKAALTFEGSTDRLAFETYIEKLLVPQLVSGQTVILDNLSSHKSAKVRELIEGCGCHLLYLPAYSPDLSPIELAFSKLKSYLRRVGARTKATLEQAIGDGMGLITPSDASGFFKHCGYPVPTSPAQ